MILGDACKAKLHGMLALAALFCVACNGGNPTLSPSPTPYPTGFGPTAYFPEHQSSVGDLPHNQQSAWAVWNVRQVPSKHIFDSSPQVPVIMNNTGGVLSDADAAKWAGAAYQTQTTLSWAEANGELSIVQTLGFPHGHSQVNVQYLQVMSQQAKIINPPCATYPTQLSIYQLDPTTLNYLQSLGESITQPDYVVVETFIGPCQVTAIYPDKHKVVLTSFGATRTEIIAGYLRVDAALGTILVPEGTADCSGPAPRPPCS